jgi:hypothetical protein
MATIQNPTTSTQSDSRIKADSEHGVIGSWWQLGIGMSESTCTFGFGVAQDVRAEVRRRADVTLSFVEEMTTGSFKFVRKLVERVDDVATEGLGRGEAAVLVMTQTLRRTGQGVASLASTTISDTIGSSGQRRNDGTSRATA